MPKKHDFLRVKQVCERLNISRCTWLAWVKKGKAPAGIHFSERVIVWPVNEIESFIRSHSKQAVS